MEVPRVEAPDNRNLYLECPGGGAQGGTVQGGVEKILRCRAGPPRGGGGPSHPQTMSFLALFGVKDDIGPFPHVIFGTNIDFEP